MNNIYRTSIVGLFVFTISGMNMLAQNTAAKDTVLNRQVYLEREYTPTIQDAAKVNTLPALHQPERKQYNINFEHALPSIRFAAYPIGDPGSGDIRTNIDFSKHRGYLRFGAGMYANLDGALGYRIVDSEKDRFDIFATHNSMNGTIKYLEKNATPDDVKAKDMINNINLRYSHTFDAMTWYLRGSFLSNQYNYYGYDTNFSPSSGKYVYVPNIEDKQSVNVITAETGVQSTQSEGISYSGHLTYNNFSTKYGPDVIFDGPKANIIDLKVDVAVPISDAFRAGINGGVLYQGIGNVDYDTDDDKYFHNLTVTNVNPYIGIGNDDLSLSVGVKISHAFDFNDKTQISPMAKFNWNFEEKSMLYASVDGGINDNSLLSIYKENKYVNPFSRVEISKTPYDIKAGVKSGVISGFEFDIFGGYKYTKDEHLYLPSATNSWGNVSDVLYADLKTGHFGGAVKTKLIPFTDLSFKAVGYFYDTKLNSYGYTGPLGEKAWGLPTLTLDLNADFTFIPNLTLTAKYRFEGGRKAYVTSVVDMDAVNELSFMGNYQIFDWLSVFAKANNILNQKYERYYGYTLQGFNAMGGVGLKF